MLVIIALGFSLVDLWIGVRIVPEASTVYICPLPMITIRITWRKGV